MQLAVLWQVNDWGGGNFKGPGGPGEQLPVPSFRYALLSMNLPAAELVDHLSGVWSDGLCCSKVWGKQDLILLINCCILLTLTFLD